MNFKEQLIEKINGLNDQDIKHLISILDKDTKFKEKNHTQINLIRFLKEISEEYTYYTIYDIASHDFIGDLSNADDNDIIDEVSNRSWTAYEIEKMGIEPENNDIENFHDYEIINQFKKIHGIDNLLAYMKFDKIMEQTDWTKLE